MQSGDWNADGAKSILKDELMSAKNVLSAAEGRLGKIETQLKGVVERATTAEDSASHAEKDLQVASLHDYMPPYQALSLVLMSCCCLAASAHWIKLYLFKGIFAQSSSRYVAKRMQHSWGHMYCLHLAGLFLKCAWKLAFGAKCVAFSSVQLTSRVRSCSF